MPIQTELEPRSDTELLALMAQRHLRALYVDNIIDPKSKSIVIVNSEGDQELCTIDYVKAECSDLDALRDALNFILDQEEI
jgi:hypothetical protein